jgi:hypothetical protein
MKRKMGWDGSKKHSAKRTQRRHYLAVVRRQAIKAARGRGPKMPVTE